MVLAVPPVHEAPPRLYIDVGQTRTPIKDIQRERGTSLEHIMVGTEYGMAPEMTHGPAAGCAFCTEDSTTATVTEIAEKEREREREAAEARQNMCDVSRRREREREVRGGNGRREKREVG